MRWLDLTIIVLYLLGITWFGARFRSSQKSLKDYFLGGREAPWWAIALSIVSAETSTLTVIGTPPLSFKDNLGFLQLVLGYLLARVAISALFLPAYFRGELFTAYQLMQVRFGERVRLVPIPAQRRRRWWWPRVRPYTAREPHGAVAAVTAELLEWLETRAIWARFGL